MGKAYRASLEVTADQTKQTDEETHDTIEKESKQTVEAGTEGSLKASLTGVGASVKGYVKGKVSSARKMVNSDVSRQSESTTVSQSVHIETVDNVEDAHRLGCQDPDCQYNNEKQKVDLVGEVSVSNGEVAEVFEDKEQQEQLTEREQQHLRAHATTTELESDQSGIKQEDDDRTEGLSDDLDSEHDSENVIKSNGQNSEYETEQDESELKSSETNDPTTDPSTDTGSEFEDTYKEALTGKLAGDIEEEINEEISQANSLGDFKDINETINEKIDEKVDDLDGLGALDEESKQKFKQELRDELTGASQRNEATRTMSGEHGRDTETRQEASETPEISKDDFDPPGTSADKPDDRSSESDPDSNDPDPTETNPDLDGEQHEEPMNHLPSGGVGTDPRQYDVEEARQSLPDSDLNTTDQNQEHSNDTEPAQADQKSNDQRDSEYEEATNHISEEDARINPRPEREQDDGDRDPV